MGALVHSGLQVWQESHVVAIPDQAIEEFTPDMETRNLALELIYGYARRYPQELWPLGKCEEPVLFPLIIGGVYGTKEVGRLEGLAKIDRYFYVPEPSQIDTGVPGQSMILNPGFWIHEYKTKSPYIPISLYMQSWDMNMQATFQCMALSHKLKGEPVQGVLINVLEKPRKYIPKRKCKGCKETQEFATYIPTGTGEYACPSCGTRQVLQPLKLDTPTVPPEYYRFPVTRTREDLERWKPQIIQVGQQMIQMAEQGLDSVPWTTKNCVDFKWNSACDYFGHHRNGISTKEDQELMDVPEYRGLVEIQ
ncbi:MAG: hypothetical protein KGI27_10065 [Thaumarchaeota archaeon]|nr:hypothetical protein [Nitrososphaerota archaeon]